MYLTKKYIFDNLNKEHYYSSSPYTSGSDALIFFCV